jgi:hypothetical protein
MRPGGNASGSRPPTYVGTATKHERSRQLQHPAQVDDFVAVYTLIRPGERLSPSRRSARQRTAAFP